MTVIRPLLRARRAEDAVPPGLETLDAADNGAAIPALGAAEATGDLQGTGVGELGNLSEPGNYPDLNLDSADVPPGEVLRNAVADRPEETIAMLRDWLETEDEREELAA